MSWVARAVRRWRERWQRWRACWRYILSEAIGKYLFICLFRFPISFSPLFFTLAAFFSHHRNPFSSGWKLCPPCLDFWEFFDLWLVQQLLVHDEIGRDANYSLHFLWLSLLQLDHNFTFLYTGKVSIRIWAAENMNELVFFDGLVFSRNLIFQTVLGNGVSRQLFGTSRIDFPPSLWEWLLKYFNQSTVYPDCSWMLLCCTIRFYRQGRRALHEMLVPWDRLTARKR